MARTIQHIPARDELNNRAAVQTQQIRVAAYCRVSTDQEEQLNSFANQVSYYKNYIQSQPRYILAGILLRNILFDAIICIIQQIKSGRSRASLCSA